MSRVQTCLHPRIPTESSSECCEGKILECMCGKEYRSVMELEQMVKLIDAVSKSSLTKFNWKEGNIEISLEKETLPVRGERVVMETVSKQEDRGEVVNVSVAETVSGKIVKSPLVGTYYSAPSPDAEPFVKVGDTVKKGQVIGIIEAMKLMNEIESEHDGVVEEILAENEKMVEYGQPLFRIV